MEYILQFFEGVHEEERRAELIEVYRKAKLADEYEAKAESYTKLASQISAMDAIVATNYDKDMTDTNLHLLMLGAEVKRFFESGEPNAKK